MRKAQRLPPLAVFFLLCAVLPGAGRASSEPEPEGVVVEEVKPGSAEEKAGIRVGDLVLAWERPSRSPVTLEESRGAFPSPFDWHWVRFEQAPRGALLLRGERAGESREWSMVDGLWAAKVRPAMPRHWLELYLEGKEDIEAGDLVEGVESWSQIAELAAGPENWRTRCWILLRTGETWAASQDWKKAQAAFLNALPSARDSISEGILYDAMGSAYLQQNALDQARAAYLSSLRVREAIPSESLAVALSHHKLGNVHWFARNLDQAQFHYDRALSIRRKLAENSLDLAATFNSLGNISWMRGNLDAAAGFYLNDLKITQEQAPGSLDLAATLSNLGILAEGRDDLDTAETYLKQALEIREKLDPGGLDLAISLMNLGTVALDRRDLRTAEILYRRALDIQKRLAVPRLDLAATLSNLGVIASARGDLVAAQEFENRALALRQEVAPRSLDTAKSLEHLGVIEMERGDLEASEIYIQQAFKIRQEVAPESVETANSYLVFADLAMLNGEFDDAEAYFKRSLEITEQQAPNSLLTANLFHGLADVAQERGRQEEADVYHRRAMAIRTKLVPDSIDLALTLENLAAGAVAQGDLQLAGNLLASALRNIDLQIRRLGGSYSHQETFRNRHRDIYEEAFDVLLQQNLPREAFHVLESTRARSLLAMLAERDLVFARDLPKELEEARSHLASRYDQTLRRMMVLDTAKEKKRLDELRAELNRLDQERDEIEIKIRNTSSKLANLKYPQPLTLREAQDGLDPGTVMLSYKIGNKSSHLFVVMKEDQFFHVKTIPAGEEELRSEVDIFREAISSSSDPRSQFFQRVEETGRSLYKKLILPASEALERASRILILPDGPLHVLPFAALLRESGEYLVEWKPIHSVLSATLYEEFKRSRPVAGKPTAAPVLTAFGDPFYPEKLRGIEPGGIDDPRIRSAVQRGLFDWEPLPYSRQEVEGIAELYPPDRVHAYLGDEATEEQAKAIRSPTRIVHFAVHGHLDNRFPLSSALALSIPKDFPEDRDNGLLQAWEIFERVRLDADLVVLSACDSALGQEREGEGLIGLTRAFQYAGARTVIATLWSVEDQVTAELMVRFHRHLLQGKTKDEALRAAQVELIRRPVEIERTSGARGDFDASAPYFWAAFRVVGDFR